MKIEAKENEIILKELFAGVILETREGKKLYVCTRDRGFDIKFENGKSFHIDEESEISIKKRTFNTVDNESFWGY